MARFDVYRSRDGEDVLLDCQSDWLEHFNTRFVVPLVKELPVKEAERLHPALRVHDDKLIMATQLASAVSVSDLGSKIANVADQHSVITDAIDMLTGSY